MLFFFQIFPVAATLPLSFLYAGISQAELSLWSGGWSEGTQWHMAFWGPCASVDKILPVPAHLHLEVSRKTFKVSSLLNIAPLSLLSQLQAFRPNFAPAASSREGWSTGLKGRAFLSSEFHMAVGVWRGLDLSLLLIQWPLQVRKLNMSCSGVQWFCLLLGMKTALPDNEQLVPWLSIQAGTFCLKLVFHIHIHTYACVHISTHMYISSGPSASLPDQCGMPGMDANRYYCSLIAALRMKVW